MHSKPRNKAVFFFLVAVPFRVLEVPLEPLEAQELKDQS